MASRLAPVPSQLSGMGQEVTIGAIQSLAESVLSGDRRALARAITLCESTRLDHRKAAEALLETLLPHSGKAVRLGISGSPGVGKSTYIEAFGCMLVEQGHRVAVLAVDPTSQVSGGSILGDKTRMEELARRSEAFIRPSPAGATLGGVARRTRETMLLCEAAGFDVVLVETVGVGQSETTVARMVDLFMLLLAPGGGDELQGLKRGIIELAELIVITKADSDLEAAAKRAQAEYLGAIQMLRPLNPQWRTPVMLTSAKAGLGIEAVWRTVLSYRDTLAPTGALAAKRAQQAGSWMWQEIEEALLEGFKSHPAVASRLEAMEKAVLAGEIAPTAAARALLADFLGREQD